MTALFISTTVVALALDTLILYCVYKKGKHMIPDRIPMGRGHYITKKDVRDIGIAVLLGVVLAVATVEAMIRWWVR